MQIDHRLLMLSQDTCQKPYSCVHPNSMQACHWLLPSNQSMVYHSHVVLHRAETKLLWRYRLAGGFIESLAISGYAFLGPGIRTFSPDPGIRTPKSRTHSEVRQVHTFHSLGYPGHYQQHNELNHPHATYLQLPVVKLPPCGVVVTVITMTTEPSLL